jgi:hypothetical protein
MDSYQLTVDRGNQKSKSKSQKGGIACGDGHFDFCFVVLIFAL